MNTQIFATMGPACGTESIIKEMIEAGMTGMRLNLSHTTLPASKDYIEAYHNAAVPSGVKPQILIDMQGPELRVGDLSEPVELEENATIRFYSREEEFVPESEGPETVIPVPLPVLQALVMGDEVLLDDGKILVKAVSEEYIGVSIGEGKENRYEHQHADTRALPITLLHFKKAKAPPQMTSMPRISQRFSISSR